MSSPNHKNNILKLMQAAYAYHQKGDMVNAEKYYQQVLGMDPKHPDANQYLALIAHEFGHHDAAIKLLGTSISADPKNPQRHYILGGILDKKELNEKAIKSYQKAIKLKPDFIEALNNLGLVFKKSNQYQDAIQCFKKALYAQKNSPTIWANLANVYKESGQMDLAVEALEKAIDIDPSLTAVYSNLLLALNYNTNTSPDSLFQKHQQWETAYFIRHSKKTYDFTDRQEPKEKLKIGYISPDLHNHSVAYFVEPLLKEHDKNNFEVFAYYNNTKYDAYSKRLESYVDHWQSVIDLSDEQLADKIFEDKIDILVDLAGHSAKNRLGVFARKPAPVQVTWLGYPNTTGLSTIDYRVTDAIADPSGEADKLNSETLIRLKDGFLCYQGNESFPLPDQIPYDKNGFITFGSFNNYVKVTPEVISIWSEILKAVPGSKLIIKSNQLSDKTTNQHCKSLFKKYGIESNRLTLLGFLPNPNDHMGYYRHVDIGLDPFPYNGTTTTFEALWMGVPSITLSGNCHASRVGESILSRIDLQSYIAYDVESYVALAQAKANALDELRALRATLRAKMQSSVLCDEKHFRQALENAFQSMWERYLQTPNNGPQ